MCILYYRCVWLFECLTPMTAWQLWQYDCHNRIMPGHLDCYLSPSVSLNILNNPQHTRTGSKCLFVNRTAVYSRAWRGPRLPPECAGDGYELIWNRNNSGSGSGSGGAAGESSTHQLVAPPEWRQHSTPPATLHNHTLGRCRYSLCQNH